MTSRDSNTGSNQRIEAVEFQAPGQRISSAEKFAESPDSLPSSLEVSSSMPWWHSQFNLMLGVFALLAVAAGLFILLTPPPNLAPPSTVVSADGSTRVEETAIASDVAPWDESRRTQARSDSQDILSELLTSKKALEAGNVKDWANERYQEALAKAAAGDEFYKQQEFVQAIEHYQLALEEMESLSELIPDVVKAKVSEGLVAIKAGKTSLAQDKFQEALVLDKNNIPALNGLDRVKTLDQVLELARSASLDEQAFASSDQLSYLTLALDKYQQAVKLDAAFDTATDGLQRVQEAINDKSFRNSMSKGFTALFGGRYSNARAGFSSALKIRPNDKMASSAYKQSLASDKRSSLTSLLSSASRLEKEEEWASALSNYQVVLQRDPNQVNAKLGQIRSQARGELHQSLVAVLSDTLDLARSTQRERANQVLADAKAIKNKGPVIRKQIADLEAALQQIGETVKVAFTSDALTDITLMKVGAKKVRLGKFSSKRLALKPGRYTITGQRIGFRDVRKEIELRAKGSQIQTFSIACDEPITGSSAVSQANP